MVDNNKKKCPLQLETGEVMQSQQTTTVAANTFGAPRSPGCLEGCGSGGDIVGCEIVLGKSEMETKNWAVRLQEWLLISVS